MRSLRSSCVAAGLVLAAVLSPEHATANPLSEQPIHVNQRQRLADQYGREVVFHGTNVVSKGPPYLPTRDAFSWDNSFVAEDMRTLQELGMNAIRLGTMWPGAEPEQGAFNQSYIDAIAGIVSESAQYNIRSLLDMHQDVLADRFCGEGVPNWAAITNTTNFPFPLQSTPFNVSSNGVPNPFSQCGDHPWAEYYPTQAVGEAFQNLYSNAFGLQDAWAKFWVRVATTAKSLGGAVLGYELLNEPWAGDIWKDILLMWPGMADKKNLQPAFDRIAQDIRTVDPLHAIFFEGVTWDWFNVGFEHVPGGEEYANSSVLSYHFYVPPDFNLDIQFAARAKDMERLRCGGFLTEFGVHKCSGCGTIMMEAVMSKCDSMFQSWTFWQLKPFPGNRTGSGGFSPIYHDNGTLNEAMAFNVSRTYAQAIAGTGRNMAFDIETGNFELAFDVNVEVTLRTTVIYASQRFHYPTGMNVTLTPEALVQEGLLSWNTSASDPNLIEVQHAASVPIGTTIGVTITQG